MCDDSDYSILLDQIYFSPIKLIRNVWESISYIYMDGMHDVYLLLSF